MSSSLPARLVIHPESPGPWNMAVDEAILHSVARKAAPPTVRFYGWHPACISLGRAQSHQDIDLDRLQTQGWDLVRRPTGGRAILHRNELTYAVIAPEEHPIMLGGVLESYRRISAGLVKGLERLSLPVDVQQPDPLSEEDRSNPICFEVPSAYEITVQGRKVIGSAQVRKQKTVLQHGSIPLTGDLNQICDVLYYEDEQDRETARRELLERASTLESVLNMVITPEEAVAAMVQGFEAALGFRFEHSGLIQSEFVQIEDLLQTRYANSSWTMRDAERMQS